jgi:hypothetical protein
VPLRIIASAARLAFLRNVKLEAVVSIGLSIEDADRHAPFGHTVYGVEWFNPVSMHG